MWKIILSLSFSWLHEPTLKWLAQGIWLKKEANQWDEGFWQNKSHSNAQYTMLNVSAMWVLMEKCPCSLLCAWYPPFISYQPWEPDLMIFSSEMRRAREWQDAPLLGSSPATAFSNCMPFYRVNFIFVSVINFETWISKRDVLSTVKALGKLLMQERGWGTS